MTQQRGRHTVRPAAPPPDHRAAFASWLPTIPARRLTPKRRRSFPPGQTPTAPASHKAAWSAMVVGALGVVFGDIGTSPLYTLRESFTHGSGMTPTPRHVLGVLSVLFWAVTLTVTIKYVTLIMRADNKGEGGVLALATLATKGLAGRAPRRARRHRAVRHRRARPVLRGRHHHPGHDHHERGRRPRYGGAGPRALRRADVAGDPGRALPAAVARHGGRRPAVRTGHAGLVPGAGRARHLADRQSIRGAGSRQSDVRHRPDRRPRAGDLLGVRLDRAGRHRRGGALRRHGPFRPQADPAGLAVHRAAGPDAQLFRPGRADHRAARSRPAGVLLDGAAGHGAGAGGAVDAGRRDRPRRR